MGTDTNTATVTALHNGSAYTGNWSLDNENYASIVDGVITLNQAPENLTPITITETNHDISTTITLLPNDPGPNDY
jgi:hypothetical protein